MAETSLEKPAVEDESKSTEDSNAQPLASVHTNNLPQILEQLKSSVVVSTYQAGKLIMLRNDGGVLNTHFRVFNKPMGLAIAGGRLAIGTATSIQEYHNVPAAAKRIEPKDKHDAAFLPRRENVTGDIQIHEMAWCRSGINATNQYKPDAQASGSTGTDETVEKGSGPFCRNGPSGASHKRDLTPFQPVTPLQPEPPELWFVNTAFSCLSVRSNEHSFQPRWRPDFITHLSPEDRCHLNGLAVVDGKAKYVTALGETNTAGGWRENKRDGGILIDVESNEIVAHDLSMPHSPRWYNDRLWILNSGTGGFGFIDLDKGRYEEVIQLEGFTRGLCFAGPLAFIGLSQVRESATFSDIPIVDRLAKNEQRDCGVWVVNITTGETVAFVKFEDAVQEIFAVEVLAGSQYPDLVQDDAKILASSYVLPDEALEDVPDELRSDGNEK